MSATRVLFATSELNPLVKTGGLADVSQALSNALLELGYDVRIIMPAYPQVLARAKRVTPAGALGADATPVLTARVRDLPPLYLIADPDFARKGDRHGNPYLDRGGEASIDIGMRFGRFGRAIAEVAMGHAEDGWRAQILHCNDWQTGLAPAILQGQSGRPATVFTIHNLAYQGLFDAALLERLHLPSELWSMHGLEFFGQLSFIKGGIAYADRITTVSPTYAREIQSEAFGCGLDGLLRARADALEGIVNGIDVREWDPERDPLIEAHYSASDLAGKAANKRALQQAMELAEEDDPPLIGFVGRLVEQKGIDLILETLSGIVARGAQLVLLGSGDRRFERVLRRRARRRRAAVAVTIGYDATLAHRIEAGADLFLMPSRFEPCGLNQLYSQRYGTLPIVRRTGGLADTVVDASGEAIADDTASGFVFSDDAQFLPTLDRALALHRDAKAWRKLQRCAMRKDLSWNRSARAYADIYEELLGPGRSP